MTELDLHRAPDLLRGKEPVHLPQLHHPLQEGVPGAHHHLPGPGPDLQHEEGLGGTSREALSLTHGKGGVSAVFPQDLPFQVHDLTGLKGGVSGFQALLQEIPVVPGGNEADLL